MFTTSSRNLLAGTGGWTSVIWPAAANSMVDYGTAGGCWVSTPIRLDAQSGATANAITPAAITPAVANRYAQAINGFWCTQVTNTTAGGLFLAGATSGGWSTIGSSTTCTLTSGNYWLVCSPKSPADRLREIIASRFAPVVIRSRHNPLRPTLDVRELRARETLRRVLGPDKYRRFLISGCVYVRAKSGLVYQIFPGYKLTNVIDCGRVVDRLCVVLRSSFPDTDWLIVRYLMILNDEGQFRKLANRHGVHAAGFVSLPHNQAVQPAIVATKPLGEVFKLLKSGVYVPDQAPPAISEGVAMVA